MEEVGDAGLQHLEGQSGVDFGIVVDADGNYFYALLAFVAVVFAWFYEQFSYHLEIGLGDAYVRKLYTDIYMALQVVVLS